jgi:hypothetical protein
MSTYFSRVLSPFNLCYKLRIEENDECRHAAMRAHPVSVGKVKCSIVELRKLPLRMPAALNRTQP